MSEQREHDERQRVLELEERVRELETRLGERAPDRQSGRKVVLLFFGLLALAFTIAFTLWTAAKRTSHARAEALRQRPKVARADEAGKLVVSSIRRCLLENPVEGPVSIRLRVKATPDGNIALVQGDIEPSDPGLSPCVRTAPQRLTFAADSTPGVRPIDLDVRYREGLDEGAVQGAVGGHVARWSWQDISP